MKNIAYILTQKIAENDLCVKNLRIIKEIIDCIDTINNPEHPKEMLANRLEEEFGRIIKNPKRNRWVKTFRKETRNQIVETLNEQKRNLTFLQITKLVIALSEISINQEGATGIKRNKKAMFLLDYVIDQKEKKVETKRILLNVSCLC